MARLTSKQRSKLPASTFAGPGRSYPIPDKGHAVAAKAFSTRAVKAGRMSSAQKAKIDAQANAMLRSGKKGKPSGGTKKSSTRGSKRK